MNALIWFTLPHLPFEFWNQKVFEGIVRSLGKFIVVDEVTKAWTRLIEVRFYVMVEFKVRIPKIMMIN